MSLHKNLQRRRKAIKYKVQGDFPRIIQINYDYVLMANVVKLLSNTSSNSQFCVG